jgi:hypothetical protein
MTFLVITSFFSPRCFYSQSQPSANHHVFLLSSTPSCRRIYTKRTIRLPCLGPWGAAAGSAYSLDPRLVHNSVLTGHTIWWATYSFLLVGQRQIWIEAMIYQALD